MSMVRNGSIAALAVLLATSACGGGGALLNHSVCHMVCGCPSMALTAALSATVKASLALVPLTVTLVPSVRKLMSSPVPRPSKLMGTPLESTVPWSVSAPGWTV